MDFSALQRWKEEIYPTIHVFHVEMKHLMARLERGDETLESGSDRILRWGNDLTTKQFYGSDPLE